MLQSATTLMIHCNVMQNLDARAVHCIRLQFAQLGVVPCFVVEVHNVVRVMVRLGLDFFFTLSSRCPNALPCLNLDATLQCDAEP